MKILPLVQDLLVSSLAGLLVSIIAYLVIYYAISAIGVNGEDTDLS